MEDDPTGTLVVCWHGGRLIGGGADGKVRVWDVEGGRKLSEVEGHGGRYVSSMWVFGDQVVTGGVDGQVVVWIVDGGGRLEAHRKFDAVAKARNGAGKTHGVTAVCGHGGRVYAGVAGEGEGDGNDVQVWDVEGSKYVNRMAGHRSWVTGMAMVMEGTFLATVSHDCTIRIWSIENGAATFFSPSNRTPGQAPGDATGLLGVAVLPGWESGESGGLKGKTKRRRQGMVTISAGGKVDLWEVSTGTGTMEVKHVEAGQHAEGELESGSVSVLGGMGSDGEGRCRVASAGHEGRVKIWGVGEEGGWTELESLDVAAGRYPIEGCSGNVSDGRLALGLGEREEGGKVEASMRVLGAATGA